MVGLLMTNLLAAQFGGGGGGLDNLRHRLADTHGCSLSCTGTLLHICTMVFNGVHMFVHASVVALHKLAKLWSIHRRCCFYLQAATTGDYASLLSAAPVIAVTASTTLEQVMEVRCCAVIPFCVYFDCHIALYVGGMYPKVLANWCHVYNSGSCSTLPSRIPPHRYICNCVRTQAHMQLACNSSTPSGSLYLDYCRRVCVPHAHPGREGSAPRVYVVDGASRSSIFKSRHTSNLVPLCSMHADSGREGSAPCVCGGWCQQGRVHHHPH